MHNLFVCTRFLTFSACHVIQISMQLLFQYINAVWRLIHLTSYVKSLDAHSLTSMFFFIEETCSRRKHCFDIPKQAINASFPCDEYSGDTGILRTKCPMTIKLAFLTKLPMTSWHMTDDLVTSGPRPTMYVQRKWLSRAWAGTTSNQFAKPSERATVR